jgi:hypothetical protein
MSAPTKAPYYWDHGTTEDGDPPAQGGPWLIDNLVVTARYFNDWMVEGLDLAISVRDIAEYKDGGVGRIGFSARGVEGEIALTLDPSGWVLAVARIGETEVFRGYIDRPWEMIDIWPPGSTPAKDEESPGRIGKKQTWVGLATDVWPALQAIANGQDSLFFEVDEAKLRIQMERERAAKSG